MAENRHCRNRHEREFTPELVKNQDIYEGLRLMVSPGHGGVVNIRSLILVLIWRKKALSAAPSVIGKVL